MHNSTEHLLSHNSETLTTSFDPKYLARILSSEIGLNSLLGIVLSQMHPLYLIDCLEVLIYDEQLTVFTEALISIYDVETEKIDLQYVTQASELTAVQKLIAGYSFPVLKTEAEWMDEEKANHALLNGSEGYQYHCYLPLEFTNKTIGTLQLHNESREFSPELLSYGNNIADLIARIIHSQIQQQTHRPETNNQIVTPTVLSITHQAKNTLETEKLIQMQERIEAINQTTQLDSFIQLSEALFPIAFSKLKPQLDEIAIFRKKMEEESLHESTNEQASSKYPDIIGSGVGIEKVFSLMDQVANSDSTVLILGETGTGKELIARAIHEGSTRKNEIMIMVNCAAIPPNLIESELFGHEKGAFTGATDKRIGKFELAEGGTLFLDEIGEMPLDLQVKLLRALQEKEIERVGGKSLIKTNVRLISATNRNLLTEVQKGRFRRDLYFRLNVFPIELPALRERTEDIPLLAMHFLNKYAKKSGKQLIGFTKGAIKQMKEYSWPGNIREMEHLIERQVLLSKKPVIADLGLIIKDKTLKDSNGTPTKVKTIDENERDHIFNVLQLCKGRISGDHGAAKLLGVPATTLNSKIKRLGLSKKHFL